MILTRFLGWRRNVKCWDKNVEVNTDIGHPLDTLCVSDEEQDESRSSICESKSDDAEEHEEFKNKLYNPNLDNKAIRFLSYLVALWVYQLLFPWVTIIKFVSGVGNLLLTTKYDQGHVTQWKSQPQTHVRAKSVTILFTGNTYIRIIKIICVASVFCFSERLYMKDKL